MISSDWLRAEAQSRAHCTTGGGTDRTFGIVAHELLAARSLIERVRRWVSDHSIDPDHPCHCGLCTALRRYDSEVGQ